MIKQFLNNYFGFNRQQRNGLYVLCCISLSLLIVRIVYPYFIEPAPIHIGTMAMVEEELEANMNSSKYNSSKGILFPFDPNTVSKDELMKLGFKERTAQTFIKFRNKGFVFKQKEDVQKIYGISSSFYEKIEPYIIIKNSITKNAYPHTASGKDNHIAKKLELNTADSSSLVELKGVGPGYAKRILKHRKLLGGFVSIDQMKEIYGMGNDLYQLIASQCTIDPLAIKKININSVDFKTLNAHPYIDYELTKHIFNFKKNTPITQSNIADVIEDDDLLKKIGPYLEY